MLRASRMKLAIVYVFLCKDRDRHGNVRYYFRRDGKNTRIRARPGTIEFQTEYDALLETSNSSEVKRSQIPRKLARTAGCVSSICAQPTSSSSIQKRNMYDGRCLNTRGRSASLLGRKRHLQIFRLAG